MGLIMALGGPPKALRALGPNGPNGPKGPIYMGYMCIYKGPMAQWGPMGPRPTGMAQKGSK